MAGFKTGRHIGEWGGELIYSVLIQDFLSN